MDQVRSAVSWAARLLGVAWLLSATGCIRPEPEAGETETRQGAALAPLTGVLTQHNDLGRTGANLNETILNTSNVKGTTFGKLWTLPVTGQVYSQPLYVANAIAGKNVVFIATEANNVYAYDADSSSGLIWSRSFEAPWTGSDCVNTRPQLGISSTPVIDPATNSIYVVNKTFNGSTLVYRTLLHVLNMTTGADKVTPVDVSKTADGITPISVPGTGDGSSNGKLEFKSERHQNRVGLTLSQGVLSIGFASHCDKLDYHGWVLRFDTTVSPPKPLAPYVTTPNTGHGGLWMGGQGFSVDAAGDLYFISGDAPAGRTDITQMGNAFVKLTNVGITGTPTVATWFMPSDAVNLNRDDLDLGSSGPLLVPGTSLLIGGGKSGIFYVLNRNMMGGFTDEPTPETKIVQRFSPSTNNGQIVGSPIWWESPAGPRLYVWPGKAQLAAFAFDRGTNRFNTTAVAKSVDQPVADTQGGQLSLSANGSTPGTGIVWGTQPLGSLGGGGNNPPQPGTLFAFNAENVAQTLWTSSQKTSDRMASGTKYIPPTIANGKVFVGTFSGGVEVYGLFNQPQPDAGVPSDAGAADAGPPPMLTCATVDGGAPQPTDWSYVYSTYFAGTTASATPGHCAGCHTTVTGGFTCGTTKDSCYAGLVTSGKVTPAAGPSSPIGNPTQSPLAWFGNPSYPLNLMPLDLQVRNARAVAAVCGWVAAGARNDKTAGQTCAGGHECASGFCVDGVCCASACAGTCTACSNARTGQPSGTCAPITTGGADGRCTPNPPCGNTGTCNGAGQCRVATAGTSCGAAASCAGGVAQGAITCNGSGTCVTPTPQTCAPFLCGATACGTSCTTAANCAPSAQCQGNVCVACPGGVCCAAGQQACSGTCVNTQTNASHCGGCGLACGAGKLCSAGQCLTGIGGACTAAAQCASGSCVDGFCCTSACGGACTACSNARTGQPNGTCAVTLAGLSDARCGSAPPCGNTGLCAAAGVCQVAPATTACRSASCAGSTATAAATCNGAGTCPAAVTTACAPYVCGATACRTTCTVDGDCASGNYCASGACVVKKATGTTCTAATQCASGFCSSDGICCAGQCGLSCQGCNSANTGLATGTCGPRTAPAGNAVCNNACTNTLTDAANCGLCGRACASGATCSNGTCSSSCTTTNALVDNFEDNNNTVSLLESRNGRIGTFKDTAGSTITPASTSTFTSATPGYPSTGRAARINGYLANTTNPVWAGLALDMLSPRAVYNASKYTGVSFWAKKGSSAAPSLMRLKAPDKNTDPAGGVCTQCSNDFGADVTLTTTWTKYTIRFATMTQQSGWGAPRPTRIDATQLYGLVFQIETPKNTNYDIWIDDVTFICN